MDPDTIMHSPEPRDGWTRHDAPPLEGTISAVAWLHAERSLSVLVAVENHGPGRGMWLHISVSKHVGDVQVQPNDADFHFARAAFRALGMFEDSGATLGRARHVWMKVRVVPRVKRGRSS